MQQRPNFIKFLCIGTQHYSYFSISFQAAYSKSLSAKTIQGRNEIEKYTIESESGPSCRKQNGTVIDSIFVAQPAFKVSGNVKSVNANRNGSYESNSHPNSKHLVVHQNLALGQNHDFVLFFLGV
jgi:hypothetical protein